MATDRSGDLAAIEGALLRLGRSMHGGRAAQWRVRRSKIALQPTAFAVLDRIHALGPVRLADVARALGLETSRASREATQLVDAGFVTQQPDPIDGRALLLQVTDAGVAARERYLSAVVDQLDGWLDGWNDRDVARLASLLGRLATTAVIDDW